MFGSLEVGLAGSGTPVQGMHWTSSANFQNMRCRTALAAKAITDVGD